MAIDNDDLIAEAQRWANGNPNRRSGELMEALVTRLLEAERHNVQLLREAVKREGRVRRAEGAIAEALNHDPLHGRKEGIHCGGMAPCIRDALTTYKPTNPEGGNDGT